MTGILVGIKNKSNTTKWYRAFSIAVSPTGGAIVVFANDAARTPTTITTKVFHGVYAYHCEDPDQVPMSEDILEYKP
jgi:hypothetical protein